MAFEMDDQLPPMENFLPSDVAQMLEETSDIETPHRLSSSSSSSPRFILQPTAQPFVPVCRQIENAYAQEHALPVSPTATAPSSWRNASAYGFVRASRDDLHDVRALSSTDLRFDLSGALGCR